MERKLNVALIGHKFMGKAHSNALRNLSMFFNPGAKPVMKVLCGLGDDLVKTAEQYGWESCEANWGKIIDDPSIDIVVIATPGNTHMEIALAAARKGKHVFCEKPLAMNHAETKLLYETAQANKIKHMVNFNYRRVPAIILARQIVQNGRLGDIRHFKAMYQQEWAGDPMVPFVWRFDRKLAGSGSMADKGSHILDLARYLIGEIHQVADMSEIFIKERPALDDASIRRKVTTDDAAMFLARFENGAMGLFETSRISIGYKNALQFEINGSKGCIRFDLESLNELELYLDEEDRTTQGFKKILATEPQHPYMDKWWPAGHIIGWEHLFIHQYYEFIKAIVDDYMPEPSFFDGMKNQEIIEAVEKAALEQVWVTI